MRASRKTRSVSNLVHQFALSLFTELPTHQWRIQDFPEVGHQPIIWPKFAENSMKMKKIGPRGGACPKFYYVDLPLLTAMSNGQQSFTPHKTVSQQQNYLLATTLIKKNTSTSRVLKTASDSLIPTTSTYKQHLHNSPPS